MQPSSQKIKDFLYKSLSRGNFFVYSVGRAKSYYSKRGRLPKITELPILVRRTLHEWLRTGATDSCRFNRDIVSNRNLHQAASQDYWTKNPEAASISQWTSNPIIGDAVYSRMTGGNPKHWLYWLLEDFFADKRFGNLLSAGCGTGDHELICAKSGVFDKIDAFDFSEASLNLARNKAKEADVKINFYRDDINTFTLGNKYDVVLCSGSVHHVKELEHFFSTVRNSLAVNGYFILNEYVGDCYNIYKKEQVDLINRLLEQFPQVLRSGKAKFFRNNTIEDVFNTDPSESVRSKLILPLLKQYFHVEICRPFGGFIMHSLYPFLNDTEFSSGDLRNVTIIRLLLEFENILMEYGKFETDFAFCICRLKKE